MCKYVVEDGTDVVSAANVGSELLGLLDFSDRPRPRSRCVTMRVADSFPVHLLLLLLLFLVSVTAKSATGDRVLVIHEDKSIHSQFSQFFRSLEGEGFFRRRGYVDVRSGI